LGEIARKFEKLRKEVSESVRIVLAVKKRTPEEVLEVIEAGATDLGENYVQEAETMIQVLGENAKRVSWHMIGGVQNNKINKMIGLFDCIQTISSIEKAEAFNKRLERENKFMPVLIEVNIGGESSKQGIMPEYEEIEKLAVKISQMKYLKLEGLMTMGPVSENPEDHRYSFRKTREFFDRLKALKLENADIQWLSMGMSDSYKIALEEGATMIRPGSLLFGKRQ